MERKWIEVNDVGRGKLVGRCEERDSGGREGWIGVAGVPRGALCLGNGSKGEFPF